MADQPSEEKTLPASDKKLRDSRKKGKVSQSKDLVSAGTLFAVIGYLFLTYPSTRDRISQLVDTVSQASANSPSPELMPAISNAVYLAALTLLYFIGPLAAVLADAAITVGIIGTLGPVFSFENVKFNLDNISPAKGFERIFSVRNIVGFVENLVKVLVLGIALWLVVRVWVQSLFEVPACGKACAVPILLAALKPLAATAVVVFLLIGFVDALVQRRLFLRDMRMTKTEFKREQKDLEGDPLIRSERRRLSRRVFSAPVVDLRGAAFVLVSQDQIVVLRYDGVDVVVPRIQGKAEGKRFEPTLARVRRLKIPIVENPELTGAVYENHAKGNSLKREFFEPVVRILADLNLLKV